MARDETTDLTDARHRFEEEGAELYGLLWFVGHLIEQADAVALTAAQALLEGAHDEDERTRLEETIERGGAGVLRMMRERHAHLFAHLLFMRLVDNFLSYISELLRLIFATRPEALRSSETVRLDEIMRHETMEDLVRYLVERRVDRLAHQGVEDLADDLDRLLGLQLFESAEDREKAIELVTFRNVIAHNRGVVNERLLRLVPNYKKSEEGERLWISGNDFFQATSFLARLVEGVDGRAIKHFKLPSRPGTESLRAMAEAGRETMEAEAGRKERERQQTERPAEGEPGDEDE